MSPSSQGKGSAGQRKPTASSVTTPAAAASKQFGKFQILANGGSIRRWPSLARSSELLALPSRGVEQDVQARARLQSPGVPGSIR